MDVFASVVTRQPLWLDPAEIQVPSDFLDHPDAQCVLRAIRMLRKEFGPRVAILGEAIGPCTMAYHCFVLENFLLMSSDEPDRASLCLERLK